MRITDYFQRGIPSVSFEVFPPKAHVNAAAQQDIDASIRAIAALRPDFMSVTYGAGGGTSTHTQRIAQEIQAAGVPALAHLTCVSSTREEVAAALNALAENGIENVLALRGDRPTDPLPSDYQYAAELVAEAQRHGGFCIGAACYPDGHVECPGQALDIEHLKAKVDAGCDFLTTQMFFDNAVLYSFLYRLARKGIHLPVLAGVMPVTNAAQIKRICALSGTTLTARFRTMVDKFGDNPAAMKQAGIAYATEQIADLIANGVPGVHIYTMNKPDVAAALLNNLSHLLGRAP